MDIFTDLSPRLPTALPVNTILHNGQYQVGRLLGDGGFGITYLAWHQKLQVPVVIKEYFPDGASDRAQNGKNVMPRGDKDEFFVYGLSRFREEAQVLAKLDHANIVRVMDIFDENGTSYFVMPYHEGKTLGDLVKDYGGKMPENAVVQLMMPLLDGLKAAHAKGVLHRDIKPQNIYIKKLESGGVMPILIDFGSARMAMGQKSKSLSAIVSEGFAPFEQYQTNGTQGAFTDIYGAAATMYYAVTGKIPPGAPDRITEDTLITPNQLGTSESFSNAVTRALAVQGGLRPQTVEEFQSLLRGYTTAVPKVNTQIPQSVPTRQVPAAQTPPPPTAYQEAPKSRAGLWLFMLAVPIIALVAFFGAQMLEGLNKPQGSPQELYQYYTAEGDSLLSIGEYQSALDKFKEAQLNQDSPTIQAKINKVGRFLENWNTAEAAMNDGWYQKAISAYQQARQEFPMDKNVGSRINEARSQRDQVLGEVRSFPQQYVDALNNGDMDALRLMYDETVLIKGKTVKRADMVKNIGQQLDKFYGGFRYELLGVRNVSQSDNLNRYKVEFDMKFVGDGDNHTEFIVTNDYTLRRRDGNFEITYEKGTGLQRAVTPNEPVIIEPELPPLEEVVPPEQDRRFDF